MHDKIFELYFTTKKDGSGIGLAQTYQVLQWHYGSVDFESVEGAGTIFRFHIPAVGAVVETGPEYAADATPHHIEVIDSFAALPETRFELPPRGSRPKGVKSAVSHWDHLGLGNDSGRNASASACSAHLRRCRR